MLDRALQIRAKTSGIGGPGIALIEIPAAHDATPNGIQRPIRATGAASGSEKGQIVITRHGRPAGILVGFATEDEWFDYQLENDPRFPKRIEQARSSLRSGRGIKLEDLRHSEKRRPKR